ncbi:MAG: SelT/SelW/SelH family protein [Thermoflavifilum aggregans]|uniref:Selenoprotein W-related protein n=1 Tax=Thermoflavifilum thermophilum TaxID=1393122 RepID=A0A1I7NHD8_9BACT|nr:SelT/SelW/SelH family protein [Thermoflavifilum thermophilum]MBX6380816.1 SelT/SelW/SelH family protein [Thermoflavifilum aggregans]SFV34063.1 selenoprotein W-related protein [Thermoflavifilum thermophilum]
MKHTLTIEYCPRCGWLLRAAWMAQEMLTTFQDELKSVTLVPSETGGTYQIRVDDVLIFDRKQEDGFPEIKILKQRVRDQINPQKSLGHADR